MLCYSSGTYTQRVLRTLFLWVDVEFCRSDSRFADAVVGYTLNYAVVSSALDRFHPEHAAVRHVDDRVALTRRGDPPPGLAPVYVRGGVPGRLAEEADDAAVDDALVSRRQRDLRRV